MTEQRETDHRSADADRPPDVLYHADGPDLFKALRLIYRRRRLGAAACLVVFLGAFVHAFTATPIYQASARLQIDGVSPNVVDFTDVVGDRSYAMRSEFYRTQYEILRSRSLARTTMDRLALWDHPEFADSQPESIVVRAIGAVRGAAWESARFVGSMLAPGPRPDAGASAETRAETRALDRFLSRLRVNPVRDSRIVNVDFTSRTPVLAADVANALVRAYIEQDLAFRQTFSQDAADWLRQRIDEQRAQVTAAELAMQRYRETHGAVVLDEREDIVGQELAALSTAATRATTDRIAREARFRELLAVPDDPSALDRFPEVLENAYIQQQKMRLADLRREEAALARELGDQHPEMIRVSSVIEDTERSLRIEIDRVVNAVRTEFEIARSEEAELQAALRRQTSEALARDRASIEYSILARNAESARGIYESLLRRGDETDVTSDLRASGVRVLDDAEVPVAPSRPRRGRVLLFGLFGGAVAALGLMFLIDTLDNRLRTPEDVQTHLDQPSLGMLPIVAPENAVGKSFRIGAGAPENYASGVRGIFTCLLFASTAEGCRSVAVTSSEPGEGKSALACSLAAAIAQSGQRTLLVDTDIRRPRMHTYWDQALVPGLSDLLVGQAKQGAVICETGQDDLWLLPGGTASPNPTGLLASERFRDLLASERERFDWIVLDTPAVLPIPDAALCAHDASHVVFVVDAEATSRQAAASGLERLSQAGASIVGVVLNKVNLERHPYYYSAYYRPSYRQYYQAD